MAALAGRLALVGDWVKTTGGADVDADARGFVFSQRACWQGTKVGSQNDRERSTLTAGTVCYVECWWQQNQDNGVYRREQCVIAAVNKM